MQHLQRVEEHAAGSSERRNPLLRSIAGLLQHVPLALYRGQTHPLPILEEPAGAYDDAGVPRACIFTVPKHSRLSAARW